jgi:serine/threonine protein kinase/WD40 repeat protein/tetratricopeptide (TPR) repeat protein
MSESTADRNPFERLAEEFADRLRRGENPSITEYIERYPEHADDIRDLFPALALVERNKPVGDDLGISSQTSGPEACRDIPDRLGDYRILRYLGEGGMGVVYEAVRESLRSHVALKVMHRQFRSRESYLRRFRTEARSAARLHHTNIVSVFDYGVHDGVCYYAMQYIAGHSLDKILVDIGQIRDEKAGFAADETSTSAFVDGGRPGPGERSIRHGAGSPGMDPSRQPVTMGLLTGRYSTACPACVLKESDTSRPTTGPAAMGRAIDDAYQIGPWTSDLTVEVCATVADEIEHAETTSQATILEPGRGRIVIAPAHEPLANSGEDQGRERPSPDGSTSSLIRKNDARYYREVARLGAQVADALGYAHERGVFHRDIKPPNLILDSLGNIWITDFGLAKFEEGDDVSQSQDIAGTLRYMAPERFRGVSSAKCDLYALGATLYEMLTLRPPFEGQDQLQLIRRIENQAPVPPRQIECEVPPDLETIVLKALAKEPDDRFETAEEMAAELKRYLENRPIRSRPIPSYQRFWRWCQRNPTLAGASIAAAVLTTILAIVSTVAAWSLARAEYRTRLQLFEALHDRARAGRFSRRAGQRFDSLEALKQATEIARELRLAPGQLDPLRDEAIACLALPDLKPTGRVMTRPAGIGASDRIMTRYAKRLRDGTIQVRRIADDGEIARLPAANGRETELLGFSPDGRYLATKPGGALGVWDIERRVLSVNDPSPVLGSPDFSPDGRRVAVGHRDGESLVYDLATGKPVLRWSGPAPVFGMAFRGDGAQIATTNWDPKDPICRIVDAESGRLVRSIALPAIGTVTWSPDGSTLATPGEDSKIHLWDAATGTRKATLEGCTNLGLSATFHPAGTVLVSNGWEDRLRLWDPILGRPWFSLACEPGPNFGPDGCIVVSLGGKMTMYRVDPALEYGSLVHASNAPLDYQRPSLRNDGRLLAVGTDRGVALWDLARGTEPAFLPIGNAWHLMFEPSGDLLTNGRAGLLRWPVRLDTERGEFRIGPPRRLPLPASIMSIDEDRRGRILAVANGAMTHVLTPERAIPIGPLDDCRGVAVSPDGRWLATASHGGGAQVWRLHDAARVADLPSEGSTRIVFSPDGKWLMTGAAPCRLWEVGTWREARQIGDKGLCFSPDGRQLLVQDASRALRLVETETGRTLARLESPDLCTAGFAVFSPDGSRLVLTTKDGPGVRIWDLRAIRKYLAGLGLDWDAPAYSDDDPARPSAPALPTPQVDYGILAGHLVHFSEPPAVLLERYSVRLKDDPNDADGYHHRAHALANLGRLAEAIDDLTRAIRQQPDDSHLRSSRGGLLERLKQYEPAIADLEVASVRRPDQYDVRERLARCCNNRAWELANGPGPRNDLGRALALSQRAVALDPSKAVYFNTLGVIQYRAGRYAEATTILARSLAAGRGQSDGFDLFFLAMAHDRLGHRKEAGDCFDRAVRWLDEHKGLTEQEARELVAFRAEAESVLTGAELPDDVFAPESVVPRP